MICEQCKFAGWKTTAAGRKHPSGDGICMWRGTLRVAGSVWVGGYGTTVVYIGGSICRKKGEEHPDQCDTFQKM